MSDRASKVRCELLFVFSITFFLMLSHSTLRAEDFDSKPSSVSTSQCWGVDQLRGRRTEGEIRKLVPEAFQPPPRKPVAPIRSLPPTQHKVLRRVELPKNSRKLIALTFDFCEQPNEIAGYQGSIVDFLRDNKVRATFFMGGKWMLSHPTRTQQIMSELQFEIGNHSWGHRNLRLLSGNALDDEIENAEFAYQEVRSKGVNSCKPAKGISTPADAADRMALFRFPFGACNHDSLRAVGRLGLTAVQWDVSSGDPTPGLRVENLVQQVVQNVRPGSIVLFHANGRGWSTPNALPIIVRELRQRGYEFGTVTDMLNVPGAIPVFTDSCFDSKPGDTDRYDAMARRLHIDYDRFTSKFTSSKANLGAVRNSLEDDQVETLPWNEKP